MWSWIICLKPKLGQIDILRTHDLRLMELKVFHTVGNTKQTGWSRRIWMWPCCIDRTMLFHRDDLIVRADTLSHDNMRPYIVKIVKTALSELNKSFILAHHIFQGKLLLGFKLNAVFLGAKNSITEGSSQRTPIFCWMPTRNSLHCLDSACNTTYETELTNKSFRIHMRNCISVTLDGWFPTQNGLLQNLYGNTLPVSGWGYAAAYS